MVRNKLWETHLYSHWCIVSLDVSILNEQQWMYTCSEKACALAYSFIDMQTRYVWTELTWTAANKWDRYIVTTCLCFLSQSCKNRITLHAEFKSFGNSFLFSYLMWLSSDFFSPGAAVWVLKSYFAMPLAAQDYYGECWRRRMWCPKEASELLKLPSAEKPPWTTQLSAKICRHHSRPSIQSHCRDLAGWIPTFLSFSLTRPWDSWMSLWSSWMWLDCAFKSESCCCTEASWDSATCRSLLLNRASLCTWNTCRHRRLN